MMNIVTEHLPPRFHWDPTAPVRGTEKFYVETAKWLAHLTGERIKVYGDYLPTNTWAGSPPDRVHFVPRKHEFDGHFEGLVCNPRTKLSFHERLIWTNLAFDTVEQVTEWADACWDGAPEASTSPIVCISEYQAETYRQCPAIANRVFVVGHGVDPTIFHREGRTGGKQVLFTSSPDRGWDYLQDLWYEADLEAQTGYALQTLDYSGHSVTNRQVADALRGSDFWVHPGRGVELFCISAIEAQACGATPIVVPNGGLAETVRFGYRFPTEDFGQGLAAVLAGEATLRGIDRRSSGVPTWAAVTERILHLARTGLLR